MSGRQGGETQGESMNNAEAIKLLYHFPRLSSREVFGRLIFDLGLKNENKNFFFLEGCYSIAKGLRSQNSTVYLCGLLSSTKICHGPSIESKWEVEQETGGGNGQM